MLDKSPLGEDKEASRMINFCCFYLKDKGYSEAQIGAALLYCITIQAHNGKIPLQAVQLTLGEIWQEVKNLLLVERFKDQDIPEA
jgi:hypothetical protein